MKIKLIIYGFIIFVFAGLFSITMLIDNHELYLGYGSEWNEVRTNNKIPIQREIFIYGLLIVTLILDIIDKIFNSNSKLVARNLKNISVITLIYLINYGIYWIVPNSNVFCMFYHPRGNPIFGFYISLIIYQFIFSLILELIYKSVFFHRFSSLIRNKFLKYKMIQMFFRRE